MLARILKLKVNCTKQNKSYYLHLKFKPMKKIIYCFISISLITAGCSPEESSSEKPLNIILLIGDGMGLSQVTSRFFWGEGKPNFQRFNNLGLIITSSSQQKITDSAAGATAFSAGIKTYNGAIGVDDSAKAVPTISEIASKKGLSTGLISTSSITHATPASFFAHVDSRGKQEEIAAFMPESGVNFFAGGGIKWFNKRKIDERNLLDELATKGYMLDTVNFKENHDPTKNYGYLFATDGMPKMLEGRGDFLPNATSKALDHLSKNEKGFFLMIEGSQIDWGGHENNAEYIKTEVIDFDKTIGLALDFAEKHGNTLVVVTADHETGGYTLSSGKNYNEIEPTFSTGGHSATLIPVFAYGPGSDSFRGIYENNEIFHKMKKEAGW